MVKRYRYYDPDPFLGIGTIITIIIVGTVIGGTSLAIQNPSFFSQILYFLDPSLKEMAEEDRKARQEMWRMIFILGLVIAIIVGLLIWYRYSERKKESRRRRYVIED